MPRSLVSFDRPGGSRRRTIFEILVILGLTLLNAVFSGAEIAVISLRKTRLQELIDAGDRSALRVQALRDQPERFLATVQVGVTVIGAAAGAYGGATIAASLTDTLHRLGWVRGAAEVSFAVVVGLIAYLSIVLGELVPKSLALRYSTRFALLVARPLLGLSWLMRPFVWLLTASSNLVLRVFGDHTTFTESRLSRDELQQLVEEAAKTGSLDPRAGEIASRAFDFSELDVSAVMVSREQIVGVRRHAPAAEVRRVLLEEGHSRMPVFDQSIDNIVGYIIAKDVLSLAWEEPTVILEDILRPVYFVPETMRAVDALHELRRRRTQIAIVVDDGGAVAGLVTIEDLVEEIVGEIVSEGEEPEQLIRREDAGRALVLGKAQIRDVNRELGIELPEAEAYTTVAGLCIELAGRIPHAGAKFEQGRLTIEVVDASARTVRAVRIAQKAEGEGQGGDD